MTYRRLTPEELSEMEKDFVRFLAAQTITSEEWVRLKAEEPERAGQLIDQFSDMVFDRVLTDLHYLEYKTPQDIKTFHCGPDKISMLGLAVEGSAAIDFTEGQSPEQMLQQLQFSGARLKLYAAEKEYSRGREAELFEMMEKGALISRDGALYKTLQSLRNGR